MSRAASEIIQQLRNSDDYHIQAAKLSFAIELKRAMDALNLTNAELATRLGVSKPMVTKLLRGDANLTIETMVKAVRKVDCHLSIKVVPRNTAASILRIVRNSEQIRAQDVAAFRPQPDQRRPLIDTAWYQSANDVEAANEASTIAA